MLRTASSRLAGRPWRQPSQPKRGILTDNAFFKVSSEVRDAVMGKRPVVALETTIYTHGFPYPENIALSELLEKTVRDHGAVPATIGVLNGVIRVGMSGKENKELLETSRQPTTIKLSRRDISYICGAGLNGRLLNGGTTISGTMILAHLAGIRVFATGGLGGVHRGGHDSMDVSADLTELGRTPVAVISSGCKSFLDIPRTLEYLETQGAGVATFADGRDGPVDFPAFWTRDSGIKSPKSIKDEQEAASIIYAHSKLQLNSGLFFANPIPEEYSIPKSKMDMIIQEAITEAAKHGAIGSDNTPFVLDHIHRVTAGDSIKANRALVKNNIVRGARVAVALAGLEKGDEYSTSFQPSLSSPNSPETATQQPEVIVAGSLAIDFSCNYKPLESMDEASHEPALHTSNPSSIKQSLGGVGHNIATVLHYGGANVRLMTPLGDDLASSTAIANLQKRGLNTEGLRVIKDGRSTPQYVAVNNQEKSLFVAMADMHLLETLDDATVNIWTSEIQSSRPEWLVIDANWDSDTISRLANAGRAAGAKIALEPVSVQKSSRLFYRTWLDGSLDCPSIRTSSWRETQTFLADLVTPNELELLAMAKIHNPNPWSELLRRLEVSLASILEKSIPDHGELAAKAVNLLADFTCILTKLGAEGVLHTEILFDHDSRLRDPEHTEYIILGRRDVIDIRSKAYALPFSAPGTDTQQVAGVYVRLHPAHKISAGDIVSVNGAGDTFLGTLLAASLKSGGQPLWKFIDIAQQGSLLTLKSDEAVSPLIKELLA